MYLILIFSFYPVDVLAVRFMKSYLRNLRVEESELGFWYWINTGWCAFAMLSEGLILHLFPLWSAVWLDRGPRVALGVWLLPA